MNTIAPALSLTITGRIPSKKNGTRRVQRGSRIYTMPSAEYEKWERSHLFDLIGFPSLKPPYRIEVVFFAPCKRNADLSNKFEGIADLLVKGEVLQDDNWFVLSEVSLKFGGVDKKNPRAEVSIYTPHEQNSVSASRDAGAALDVFVCGDRA